MVTIDDILNKLICQLTLEIMDDQLVLSYENQIILFKIDTILSH